MNQEVFLNLDVVFEHLGDLQKKYSKKAIYKSFSLLLLRLLKYNFKVFRALLSIDLSLTDKEIEHFCLIWVRTLMDYVEDKSLDEDNEPLILVPEDCLILPRDGLILLYEITNYLYFIHQIKNNSNKLNKIKIISILPPLFMAIDKVDINVFVKYLNEFRPAETAQINRVGLSQIEIVQVTSTDEMKIVFIEENE